MSYTGKKLPLDSKRINQYGTYQKLLKGEHFEAYSVQSKEFSESYEKLRYITANFAGLVAKINGDFLFGEELQIKGDKNTEWMKNLWFESKMKVKTYESALQNSAKGDSVFRIYVRQNEVRIQKINPNLYFPKIKGIGIEPEAQEHNLIWKETYTIGKDEVTYLVVEKHTAGFVETEVYKMKDKVEVGESVSMDKFNASTGNKYKSKIETGIDKPLVVHIPNYVLDDDYFGTSDFVDIFNLNFALNNRLTKNDNILDKHSDPILALPEGVLDEDGNVRKEAMGMIEMAEGSTQKPEYIVWNANLDAAFKQIDQLVKFLFLFSETSPDTFGLNEGGQAESGRALKLRLLRTIAKISRKRLYYDQGLKEVLIVAQKLAKKKGYTVRGEKIKGEYEDPDLMWSDGIVNDYIELVETETLKLESGLTSQKRAIQVVENVDEEQAEDIMKEIKESEADFEGFYSDPKKTQGVQLGKEDLNYNNNNNQDDSDSTNTE